MEIPAGIPNCPPGLEYLTMLDQLLIEQKINLAQVLVGFEQNNKFAVKNSFGQDVRYTLTPFIEQRAYFQCNIFSLDSFLCAGVLGH